MTLLDRLRGSREPARDFDINAYAEMVGLFMQSGMGYQTPSLVQTLAGTGTERPAPNFHGLATQAYASNGVVFACMLVRQLVFSSVRFQFQAFLKGKPSETFGDQALAILERPWPGGTTQDLLSRMLQDADLAGNSYWYAETPLARLGTNDPNREMVRLRPDWVVIVGERRMPRTRTGGSRGGQVGWTKRGYIYTENGPGGQGDGVPFTVDEVVHFAPVPNPLAAFTGMSWLTPIIREIQADHAMTRHQRKFMDRGATPNMIIKHPVGADLAAVKKWEAELNSKHGGVENAYKNLNLYPGVDATVVGVDLNSIDFKGVRAGGETRIAAAAGVPPVIVGLSEGLAAATYCGVYDQEVWSTRGPIKLGEISAGDAVWSFVDGHLEARKVLWQDMTGTKPVYTVRTKNRTIRFTDNHPILVRVPGSGTIVPNAERHPRVEWRRVDQLRAGDRIVQAQRLPDQGLTSLPNGSPATADVLQWLGAYTGDGCLSGDHSVRMCMPPADRAREHYVGLAEKLFTKQLSWQAPTRRAKDGLTDEMIRLRGEGLTFAQIVERMGLSLHPMSVRDRVHIATREYTSATAPIHIGDARNAFQFSSRTTVQWHRQMGVTGGATTKRVPGWIFELSEDLRLAYLAGIVDTDGSVGKDGRLAIQFAGRGLVEDVRMLLISCGIACSNIARIEFKASCLPNAGLRESYEAWRFVASSAVEVARIPFADQLYRERVNAHQHRHRPGGMDAIKAGLHEDLGFYTIRSIEIGAPEPVYDIEVEGGHSFLADGVVVHNSNYGQARRRLADGTAHPLWQNIAGSLERLVPPPNRASRLWYDASDVPFLREDEADAANIAAVRASTVNTYITAGFTPDSAVKAVDAGDINLLVDSGLRSVQLLPPGTPTKAAPSETNSAPPLTLVRRNSDGSTSLEDTATG